MEILNYGDYRDFLKHTVETKKKSGSKFSYQSFANKLGVTKSYLKLVVEKRRHISLEKAFPICRYFKFSQFESQCFYFMLLKSSVKDPADQEFFNSILRSYASFKIRNRDVTPDDKPRETFFEWVNMAIMGLAKVRDCKNDVDWLHQKLGGDMVIDRTSVANSLEFLIKSGIVAAEGDKLTRIEKPLRSCVSPWDMAGYQLFQTGLLRTSMALDLKGKTSLHRPSRHQMYTLTLSHANIRKVIELYDEFDKKLAELSDQPQEHEAVMLVSNNIFRITTTDESKIPGTPAAANMVSTESKVNFDEASNKSESMTELESFEDVDNLESDNDLLQKNIVKKPSENN